jgi:hypothetical protein
MRHFIILWIAVSAIMIWGTACERLDDQIDKHADGDEELIFPSDVAVMLSNLPLEGEQVREVHDAVSSSVGNGYDEEYTMSDLFRSPGTGVGEDTSATKADSRYGCPLRSMIAQYVKNKFDTKSEVDDSLAAVAYIKALTKSGMQIYWPFSENWDGKQLPVITFDPDDNSDANEGYSITVDANGERKIEKVIVNEQVAMERPVWVVNRNDDGNYSTLQVLRREDPNWGTGGGAISLTSTLKVLLLKSIKMKRNYDTWFAGGSEFFIKCGAVEDFCASTEAEMKIYQPTITDFMVVIKRRQKGEDVPMNVVLVSDWTDQLESCAFMVTEDDGGTKTSWKCSAAVKIKSKSYGFDMSIPFNSSDDIVWRGQLSRRYLEKYNRIPGHFGDLDLTFSII